MSKIMFYTGGCCEPKSAIAVNKFDDVSKAQYLTTGDLGVTAFKEIMFLESSSDIDWRVRRYFDLDLDDIDTDLIGYFVLDSVSDFSYRLIDRENAYGDAEYFTKRVAVNIDDFISKIRAADAQLIILSDDVGCSVRPTDKNERLAQEVIGNLNRYIAGKADEVYVVWFFEDEENFRKGSVHTCLGAGKSFMVRKKLDRTIEEYAADYDARNMGTEG